MQMFTSDQPVNVLLLICIHAPTSSPDGAPIRSVLSVSAWPLRRSFVADYALFPAAGVINMSWMGRAKRKLLYIYWSCFSPGLAEPGRVGSQISHRRIQWFVLILTFSVNVHYVGFLFYFFSFSGHLSPKKSHKQQRHKMPSGCISSPHHHCSTAMLTVEQWDHGDHI